MDIIGKKMEVINKVCKSLETFKAETNDIIDELTAKYDPDEKVWRIKVFVNECFKPGDLVKYYDRDEAVNAIFLKDLNDGKCEIYVEDNREYVRNFEKSLLRKRNND